MTEPSAAHEVRQDVQASGGRLELTPRELRDAFARGRLTTKARLEIEAALAEEGISVEPSLLTAELNEPVVLVHADGLRSTLDDNPSEPVPASYSARPGAGPDGRDAGPLVAGALGLLVTLLAWGSFGADGGLLKRRGRANARRRPGGRGRIGRGGSRPLRSSPMALCRGGPVLLG